MWALLVVFVVFDLFIVYSEVGTSDFRRDVKEMYKIILENGVSPDKISNLADSDNELEVYYADYVNKYRKSYENLDMQSIQKMKEDMSLSYLNGSYKKFIDRNYAKLQKRVEEIKSSGEDEVGFYPGDGFAIHSKLYTILKLCIMEMLIMMCFSVLYLMDFERIHRTGDLVFTCRNGRKNMCTKMFAGMFVGLGYSVMILLTSFSAFFLCVPMKGLWSTPISSFMVMESSGLWEYPFITFVRLGFGQMFVLSVVTALILTLIIGFIAGALQLFVGNSYVAMIGMSAVFLGLLALACAVQQANWLKTIVCLNPAILWSGCRHWFMESDISLSFAWNEWWTLGIWAVIGTVCMVIGWRYFCRKDY
jgi:hypothetical protein